MTNEQAWAKVGQGESEETYIVGSDYTLRNQSRSFIENSDKYFTMAQEIGLPVKTIKMIKNLNSTIALHKVRSDAIDAALRGEIGTGTFVDYRGERVLSSYKPLAIPGVNWVIMSEVDEAEALAPAGVLLNKMLLIFFASIVTIVILAVYFARSITRPLSVLQENAKELAEGNLNIDIKTDGHDEIGDLARSFIVMRNSIKQLVGNLRDYGEQLEGRGAVRTEELHQAREAAEEANRAKSRFLANMSHELRTPMNAIIGYSEMIMEESEDLDQLEFVPDLKKIQGAGKHLLSLINDILDISKIEAGRMDLYLETFNVEQMLHDIESTVIPLTEKRGNQLVFDSRHPLGEITTDLTKVRQALLNLISNASKFTENGTVTLSTQRKIIDSQEWIEFQVTDSGIGIAENKLGILFDEFTQADDSTTRNYGGTGLGLAITKRFCEMLGGTISVRSELGEGTIFTICLPVLLTPPVDMEERESGGVVGESAGSVVHPVASKRPLNTILVIDDDPDMLDMMVRFLQKEDYQVITASSGEEGLLFAKEFQPMVITLDVLMPQVDGWDVLKLLKSDPETTDIPVVMLTLTDDRSIGLALGAIEYLSKPVDRKQLLKILNRYCPNQPVRPILVLEDDTTMREMLCRTLTKEGWDVREANNGKVALEKIRQEIPGMILLDLLMPIMDGFTFLKELRKEAAWRDIPVLVITSKDITLEEKQLLEEKVVTILQKGASTRQDLLKQVSLTIKHFVPKKND
jgi:signal transduction histidine kinase/DNA-binding response OmpR family regulator